MKATEFSFTVLVYLSGGLLTFFITKQVWPWFTKVRWPAHQEAQRIKAEREYELKRIREQSEIDLEQSRQKQQFEIQQESLEIQRAILDNLAQLKVLVSQNMEISKGIDTRLSIIEGLGKIK